MASKNPKKAKALSTADQIRRVAGAMKRCGCAAWEFFFRAATAEGATENCIEAEVEKFRLQHAGLIPVNPDYAVPTFVLKFAETVHQKESPRDYFQDLRRTPHPQVQASA